MKQSDRFVTWCADALSINAAFMLFYAFRVRSGVVGFHIEPEFFLPMAALWVYWSGLFFFYGLYRQWYDRSRLDEMISVIRATLIGILLLFFLIVLDDLATNAPATSRMLILAYWFILGSMVSVGRLTLRMVQRRLLLAGIGVRPTVIVGWSRRAFELCDMIQKYPALGYRLVGFVAARGPNHRTRRSRRRKYNDLPILGDIEDLPKILDKKMVKEILVGLDSRQHEQLLAILRSCDGRDVGIKIMADLYDIVTGQARVHSIFGVSLLEVQPQIMAPWEEAAKRSLDVVVASLVLLAGLPIWILVVLCIKLDSKGNVFYRQERVGRNGRVFRIMKFRSMKSDAEKQSGPVWAGKNDPRVTRVGKLLRRMHLDEVPQFWNVLIGDMSLVGPRPERPYFVEKLSREIPLYKRRLRFRPGITGWAQVKHKYDESIDDVKTKVKYDLFYIENASWRFDLKILLNTLYVMIMRRGHT